MVSSKRKSRELALQVLFSWDAHGEMDLGMSNQIVTDGDEDAAVRKRALEMASAAWQERERIDKWIARLAPQWPTHRQPAVDRNLLRLAVWELTSRDTPPKVVLDEAIEMAKAFSTEQSPAFVNGVLDAILAEYTAEQQSKQAEPQANT
jgi:N utilization substance protein B